MDTLANLARLRTVATQVMLDKVTVTRLTRGPLDESTGMYPETPVIVYTGPARIKTAPTTTQAAAGVAVDASRPVLELPWTTTAQVAAGDLVHVDSGPLAGQQLDVFAELTGTTSVARRYVLERRQVAS